jgi:4-hydroxy-2-oxoheptanedioate aldolase
MFHNTLKEKLRKGEAAVGIFAVMNSPDVMEILGLAGFDFAIIDCEHGPMGPESALTLIRAAERRGLTPIVRIPNTLESTVLHFLDIGAHGLQVPQVNTVETAANLVRHAKYYPVGRRGVAFMRSSDYGMTDPEQYFSKANEETLIVVHCENIEGLENLDEICKIPEIDVIFVGPYDMSQSLGLTGQVNHERVEAAVQKALEITRRHGKLCGTIAGDGDMAKMRIEQGFKYVAISLDSVLFAAKCRQEIEKCRD